MADNNVNLPPGFRFCPTDEEIVVHFLLRKAQLVPCQPNVIPDLDHCPYDPWELDGKAFSEGNQWYFFSRKTENKLTSSGYWKPLAGDEPIYTSANEKIGLKKLFAFFVGEAPDGIKTNWVMHEFCLSECGPSSRSAKRRGHPKIDYSRWVLCRVHERNCNDDDNGTELSCLDEVFLSLDDLDEISLPNFH